MPPLDGLVYPSRTLLTLRRCKTSQQLACRTRLHTERAKGREQKPIDDVKESVKEQRHT